jgi:hypothetical protein
MKLTQFDDLYPASLGMGGTTLIISDGSNSGSTGGDLAGDPGDYDVVGLGGTVSLGSNLSTAVALGDVLTIIQASPATARFSTPSNVGMTNPMTTKGDVIVGDTGGTPMRKAVGSNGQVLTADSTAPGGIKWDSAAGGGSDLVQVASGAGGVRIPGLSGSPDIQVAGANDDEFDTTDTSDPMTGWTTMGSPTAHDINSTVKSHYYLKQTNATSALVGIYRAAPSTPFTVTVKVSDVAYSANYASAALFVGETTPGKMVRLETQYGNGAYRISVERFNSPSAYVDNPYNAANLTGFAPLYLRMVVTSSTSFAFYWSRGGMVWSAVATGYNPGFTVGSVGLNLTVENSSNTCEAAFDWIRFT